MFIPIDPVPASRPRFTRSGHVFYGKNYTEFRKQAAVLFQATVLPPEFPLRQPMAVTTAFIVRKPKTSKLLAPRGDVDNYFKTLDVLNEVVWKDDVQLLWASMSKSFGETPGIELEVTEIGGLEVLKSRTLSEMRQQG
jgi:Holliday junction resolvase RusA-like endonuclease